MKKIALLFLAVSMVASATPVMAGSNTTVQQATAQKDAWGREIRTTNLPKNAKDYPYILKDIPNEMYEMAYPHSRKGYSKVSAQIFKEKTFTDEDLTKIMKRVVAGYNLKLNVDYKTINTKTWGQELFKNENQAMGSARVYQNNQYAAWVKKNKIKIEGSITPEPSMLYRSGLGGWYVRAKVKFKIDSYNEYKDLFHDAYASRAKTKFAKGVWYEGYVDINIGTNNSGDFGNTVGLAGDSLFYNSIIRKAK